MKYLILMLILLSCSTKGYKRVEDYSKLCVEGVTYIRFGHGLTVALNKNSKIIPCE